MDPFDLFARERNSQIEISSDTNNNNNNNNRSFLIPFVGFMAPDLPPSPRSPSELATRIRKDYVVRNYLWTGDIDLACFDENCQFTDPTISFTSRDTFVRNTQNLKVLVDKIATRTRSELLDITVNDDYMESRWNMVGDLTGLFWKPRIDVIGRTKFWYKTDEDGGVTVYFYDESWEIPAREALLQLITPAGKAS